MTPDYNAVTDKQKEHCAIVNMRLMLTEFTKERNISFNDAMMLFAESPVYSLLFDFDSELWKEGPKYLLETFTEYFDANIVTDTQRENAALTTMRLMLDSYANEENITFDEAMKRFTTSIAYVALFDYETGLWKEGPDYLRNFWEQCEEE